MSPRTRLRGAHRRACPTRWWACDDGLRVVLWNPAAEALLGRSARRTIGRALKEVFPPDTSLVRHLSDTLATGREPIGVRRR